MITRLHVPVAVCLAAALTASTGACQRVPLLAPSGSTIVLNASTTVLPLNGTTTIVAQVLEPAGTPPHSGTHVTFTTSLGTMQPQDAETDISGRAVTTFVAGPQSGTATITAISGGASVGTNGAIKIAIGAAAVGRVVPSANPTTVSSLGGSSTITANVADVNGNPLGGIPVTFTTTGGTLSSALVATDQNGNAQTILTTTVQATVTATAGVSSTGTTTPPTTGGTTPPTTGGTTSGQASGSVTVSVNPIPTVSIQPTTTGQLTAGTPITFNVTVTPATNSTTQVRDVKIDYGDGRSDDLGAVTGTNLPVQHAYSRDGTYTVRVIVTDSLGFQNSAATVVVVLPQPPLSVSISQTSVVSPPNKLFTFTATVTPNTAVVASYFWDFGDGNSQTTTSNQVTHSYADVPPSRVVTLTVTTTTGQTATGTTVAVLP